MANNTGNNAEINIFWFRRDLRTVDNTGLFHALNSGLPILPVFIFDQNILEKLEKDDPRISFIHERLIDLNSQFKDHKSSLWVEIGKPGQVFEKLINEFNVRTVFTNHDYEPYALERDEKIKGILAKKGVAFCTYKDQVILEKEEVVKDDGKPYTVFTPYMKKWRAEVYSGSFNKVDSEKFLGNLYKFPFRKVIELKEPGFSPSQIKVPAFNLDPSFLKNYVDTRDYPFLQGTSHLGPHLRFGTISIREVFSKAWGISDVFCNELIWREFFMQILFHFPQVEKNNFRRKYDRLMWRNDEREFEAWCRGETGYPLVDAGMRELNETGSMHNRIRMVTASFLCKHLLVDWRWGEAYFASKLLDYELSSNNGNWQWAAGTGCDAVPYFRIFNPQSQQKKFDPDRKYIKKWIPESQDSPDPIVEHKIARERALKFYGAVH